MITNSSVTIYHYGFNETTRLESWTRYNYENAWIFRSEGASVNKGYNDTNRIEIRLPYSANELDISNFAKGDIIVVGTLTENITSQQDLSNYEIYNITSIKNNNFGIRKHIHIGGI